MRILRLFLAIEIPEEIKHQFEKQVLPLRRDYPEFAWILPHNYHVNIINLGDVPETRLEKLSEKIETALYDAPSFHMFSLGTDLFIDQKIELYVDFQRAKKLEELELKLAQQFVPNINYKYTPHLTIANYKLPSKQQYYLLKKKLHNMEISTEFEVKSISLFESILTKKVPIYNKIAEFPLLTD
jgi:2'-5' RNA ligase